jgi:hypothetical protein
MSKILVEQHAVDRPRRPWRNLCMKTGAACRYSSSGRCSDCNFHRSGARAVMVEIGPEATHEEKLGMTL